MPIQDLFQLQGRVAVVTGGAGLLGAAFARTLAEAGAQVVVADRNTAAAGEVTAALNGAGFTALALDTDITQPDSVQQMVAATLEAFGGLDILVNSAAQVPKFDPHHQGEHQSSFENYSLEAWNQALAVDLTGMFLCCQAAVRPMLAAGQGVIVNLCSIYGLVAPDQRLYERPDRPPEFKPVPYSVTKAGVLGLTRYLAAYYTGQNIRTNALTPGGVYQDHDEHFLQAYAARTVLGRMAEVDDLQGALLFLASDASAYMTGANLVVDGGWTAW
jgi:2-deoxy-D-gluconate 3-dehydrogenase